MTLICNVSRLCIVLDAAFGVDIAWCLGVLWYILVSHGWGLVSSGHEVLNIMRYVLNIIPFSSGISTFSLPYESLSSLDNATVTILVYH